MDIPGATRKIFEQYERIRGVERDSFDVPFWDAVVLTAADEDQRAVYEAQIEAKITRRELPLGLHYIVYADPPGPKAGSGGSTLYVLHRLWQTYGKELRSWRVLLLNAGGQSQRLPSASVLGKVFSALPMGQPIYQMLDLKLAGYMAFLPRMPPGIFHGSADTIEVYDLGDDSLSSWTFENPGFTALAHPSPLDIGSTHGVFVLDPEEQSLGQAAEFRSCLEVLQKPSVERMRAKGAVLKGKDFGCIDMDDDFAYTDSVFFFDINTAMKLLKFYEQNQPMQCEIDSYGDFLQALGPNASSAYTGDVRNIACIEPKLVETRMKIFNLLKGTPLNIVALNASKFYHLGTMKECLYHFCSDSQLRKEVGFNMNGSFNSLEGGGESMKGCLMHNYFDVPCDIPDSSVVEFCSFHDQCSIGSHSIVSNCVFQSRLQVPDNVMIHTIPVTIETEHYYVTVIFRTDEDIKKKAIGEENALRMTLMSDRLTVRDVKMQRNFSSISGMFSSSTGNIFALWNAKIFAAYRDSAESVEASLNLYYQASNGKFCPESVPLHWLSMADVMRVRDANRMLHFREELRKKIHDSQQW